MEKITNFLTLSLIPIGVLLCTSVPSQADSITQTFSYAATPVSWENFDLIKQLVLGPGATLDGVGIYTTIDLQDSLSASNKASSAQTVKRFTDQITLTDNFASYGTNVGFTGSYVFNSHTTHDFGTFYSTNTYDTTYTLPGDLAQFIGYGVISNDVNSMASINYYANPGGAANESENPIAGYQMEVIYYYTGQAALPTPEPSTGILLGVGGLIFGGLAWWRKVARKT